MFRKVSDNQCDKPKAKKLDTNNSDTTLKEWRRDKWRSLLEAGTFKNKQKELEED